MKHTRTYRHWISAPLCLAMVALAGCEAFTLNPPPAAQIAADAGNVVDDREIVALVPTSRAAASLLKGASAEGFTLREERDLPGLGLKMQRYTIPQPLNGTGAIAALERIEPSATAGVNHAYRPAAASLDYAGPMMQWPASACPALGPIGMLDTGVDASLPEFSGVTIHSRDFTRGTPAATTHGTEVASVLADPRRLSGVTLYSAAVIGTSARGEAEAGVDSLLAALDWLTANGVHLVNVSLAGPYNKLLDRGIDRAEAHGVTIVAAVGNDGAGSQPRYPAALDNVIGVTAVDANGEIYRNAVRGTQVDVAAPGVDVMLTLGARTRFATGTSIATPFVTARIASDANLYNSLAAQIRSQLAGTSDDLGTPGLDPVYGAGLLKVSATCG